MFLNNAAFISLLLHLPAVMQRSQDTGELKAFLDPVPLLATSNICKDMTHLVNWMLLTALALVAL